MTRQARGLAATVLLASVMATSARAAAPAASGSVRADLPNIVFILATDPGQQRNRIAEPAQAKRVAELRALFLKHNDHDDKTHEPRTTAAIQVGGR